MDSFLVNYLHRLVGHKIDHLAEIPEHKKSATPAIPGFVLDDGTHVWIMCDPEGNGPGHLEIEESK